MQVSSKKPLSSFVAFLESIFPPELAEDWDNVGLLLGDPQQIVRNLVTCLTVTPEVIDEAIAENANLIITHHPFPFQAVKRITTETPVGVMLLKLIEAKIAVYSPHTAHDSAETGINQQLAEMLGLTQIKPLNEVSGRYGRFEEPIPFADLVDKVRRLLRLSHIQYVDSGKELISTVAIGCGAAGEFLKQAAAENADCFLLGETRFHTYLEAKSRGISLILPGHYASERFAMERLASRISEQFPEVCCIPSNRESDPLVSL